MVLPIGYLVLRASQGGTDILDLIWRPRTFMLLRNTVVLATIVTVASVLISLPAAWLTSRTDLPWRRFWSVALVLPLAVPSYVGAFAIVAALGPRGLLQSRLETLFGIERLPEIYGLFGAALTLTLLSYPYVLLTLNATISSMDTALEEASRSMGYGSLATFRKVTLPLLRPAVGAGSLLVALYVFSDFGAVSLLQFDSFTRAIYTQYTGSFDRTLAAGLALVLVGLTVTLLGFESWSRGGAGYHRSTAGVMRPSRMLKLGRWKAPAVAYCATVVGLALVMPIGVILYWLVRGLRAGEPLRLVWDAGLNSAYVSLLAALVAVLLSIPVVLLSVRHAGPFSGLIERATYAGYALPGIVVALSLVFFGANYAPFLYQTTGMLVLAYVVRFIPQAVGSMRAALLQVSPHIEEAARSLGYNSPRVWLSVTGPLARHGLLSGGLLVFLTVMKELPATLLLRPIGFNTLATRIWGATAEGFWARAAAPALLLILISAIPMIVISLRQSRVDASRG
ncbi:MAG: iron ABC transporter permease [Chloroflexia bacterium]|nr:iron ABC transporter permease [Chloroflexia bacterium]